MARLGFFLPHMPRPGIELVSFQLHLINGPYLERFTSLSYRLNSSKAFHEKNEESKCTVKSNLFSSTLLKLDSQFCQDMILQNFKKLFPSDCKE